MNFTNWLICFTSKCENFYFCFFSENTHPRKNIDVINMADFSSVFVFKTRTHAQICLIFHPHIFFFKTRTHAQIWILQSGLFVSSQNVRIFILTFFWKDTHTHRYRCYKDGRFFIRIFFSKHAHTHRYEFYKVAYLFHLKMSELLFLLFSENTHTRTDIDVIKMADFFHLKMFEFLSLLFSENTHTRTDMSDFSSVLSFKTRTHAQTWILQTCWFRSFQNVWIFILVFFWKHTHTHRYEFYKMTDLFHLKMSEFLSLLFFWKYTHTHRYRCYKDGRFFIRIFGQNTHTRTDINFTHRWFLFSFRNVRLFILGFFLKHAHSHRCRCYKDGRFFIRI